MAVNSQPRWRQLRIQAFALDVQIKDLAKRLDYHREYVSQILRGDVDSKTGLDRIEKALAEIEQERKAQAA